MGTPSAIHPRAEVVNDAYGALVTIHTASGLFRIVTNAHGGIQVSAPEGETLTVAQTTSTHVTILKEIK